jgi:hypothetical protein
MNHTLMGIRFPFPRTEIDGRCEDYRGCPIGIKYSGS